LLDVCPCPAGSGVCNRDPFFHFQSIPDFLKIIARAIAIKNISGKITIRFFIFNRRSIFWKKTDPDFFRKTGSRSKNRLRNRTPVVNRQQRRIQISLTFHDRAAFFPEKTDRVFLLQIDPRF